MPNVAIIGTEGAGKTVFITTLAHLLMQKAIRGISLRAFQNAATFKYIEKNWHRLQNREWPDHTAAGKSPDLKWSLRIDGKPSGNLRVLDASGHDIRTIFADDNIVSSETFPEALKKIAEYCRTSDVAVLVVNLEDYEKRLVSTDHIDNEAVLMSVLDYLESHGKQHCIVLAQADLYEERVAAQSGASKHECWLSLLQEYLSTVYAAHVSRGTPVFPMACVGQTEMEVITDTGAPRRVPRPGFTSVGLDPFLEWLAESVASAQRNAVPSSGGKGTPYYTEAGSPASPPQPPPPEPPPEPPSDPWPAVVAACFAVIVFLGSCSKQVSVPGDWPWSSPVTHTEFDGTSIPLAIFVFFVVWGILSAIRAVVNAIRRGLK